VPAGRRRARLRRQRLRCQLVPSACREIWATRRSSPTGRARQGAGRRAVRGHRARPPTAAASAAPRQLAAAAQGEELRCNGCHDRSSGQSHGRANLFARAWPGATHRPPSEQQSRAVRRLRRDHGQARPASAARPAAPRCFPRSTSSTRTSGPTRRAGRRPTRVRVSLPDLGRAARERRLHERLARRCARRSTTRRTSTAVEQTAHHPRCGRHDVLGTTPAPAATPTRCGRRSASAARPARADRRPSGDQPLHSTLPGAAGRRQRAGARRRRPAGRLCGRHDPVTGQPQLAPCAYASINPAARADPCASSHSSAPAHHAGRLTPAELKLVSEWVTSGPNTSTTPSPRRSTDAMKRGPSIAVLLTAALLAATPPARASGQRGRAGRLLEFRSGRPRYPVFHVVDRGSRELLRRRTDWIRWRSKAARGLGQPDAARGTLTPGNRRARPRPRAARAPLGGESAPATSAARASSARRPPVGHASCSCVRRRAGARATPTAGWSRRACHLLRLSGASRRSSASAAGVLRVDPKAR